MRYSRTIMKNVYFVLSKLQLNCYNIARVCHKDYIIYMEFDSTFSWLSLHVHFRWGVALVGEFFTGHCSPHCGTLFQVQGVYRETALRRGRDYEEGLCVAFILPLSNIFVKIFCIKEL